MIDTKKSTERNMLKCRSFLFVPGDRLDLLTKAMKGSADAICLDLEDGVAETVKATARHTLPHAFSMLHDAGRKVYVRVNSADDTVNHEHDLAALIMPLDGIVLPKATGWSQATGVAAGLHESIRLIAMIEDPKALRAFEHEAVVPNTIEALLLGTEDFGASCGCAPDAQLVKAAYIRMVLAAKASGIKAYGMPCGIADYKNLEAFTKAAAFAKEAGGDGAFAIHPHQVEILNAVFSVSEQELVWAHNTVSAFEAAQRLGLAITSRNGQMIDQPIYARACKLLAKGM